VRLARPSLVDAEAEALDYRGTELQVFLEVLLTLAMGYDVVVPQSYALDSWAFVRIAGRVREAREAAGSKDRPFRLHLFGDDIDTYRDARAAMLNRVHDPNAPFVSSLLPGLAEVDPGRIARLRDNPDKFWSWADTQGDDLGPLLQSVDAEFRAVGPVAARPTGPVLSLTERLRSAMASDAAPDDEDDSEATEVRAILTDALRRLDTSHPAAFSQRSRLRHD
jgi:hypothetical protein